MSKYNVGDLVACPRKTVEDMWGICIVLGSASVDNPMKEENLTYYTLYSPVRNNIISMPQRVLEESWYLILDKGQTNGRE